MTVHFDCTRCGKCCHDLRLPLSIDEALTWIEHGGDLQVLCEAIPYVGDTGSHDPAHERKMSRAFAADCGQLPVRIIVILAAAFKGACPHLQANMQCGFYDRRPRVCRIYPAEINPFVPLVPDAKACPPEAWAPSNPILIDDEHLADPMVAALVKESSAADSDESQLRAMVCAALGVDHAALTNEGYVVYSPTRDRMLQILKTVADAETADRTSSWKLVSNQAATMSALGMLGAAGSMPVNGPSAPFEYLGFLAATEAAEPGLTESAT